MTREERKKLNWEKKHRINNNGKIERQCSVCKEWKIEEDEFYLHNKSKPEKGYCPECKACGIKRSRNLILQNHEEYKKYQIQWHINNKEHHNKNKQRWHQENKEKRQEDVKRFHELHPEKQSEYAENHRDHDITTAEWEHCKDFFKNENGEWCCAYCGMIEKEHKELYGEQLHKDHTDHNGYNDIRNCTPACWDCNSRKWQHDMETWFRKQSFFTEDKLNKIILWNNNEYKKYIEDKPSYRITRKQNEDGKTYHFELWSVDEMRNLVNMIFAGKKKKDIIKYIKEKFGQNEIQKNTLHINKINV